MIFKFFFNKWFNYVSFKISSELKDSINSVSSNFIIFNLIGIIGSSNFSSSVCIYFDLSSNFFNWLNYNLYFFFRLNVNDNQSSSINIFINSDGQFNSSLSSNFNLEDIGHWVVFFNYSSNSKFSSNFSSSFDLNSSNNFSNNWRSS